MGRRLEMLLVKIYCAFWLKSQNWSEILTLDKDDDVLILNLNNEMVLKIWLSKGHLLEYFVTKV